MIRRLPEAVVERIAAGEVVVRPTNAVKELVENALDAASDAISIVAVNGGVTKVVVEDNGHGISAKEDFVQLCERFTTSKLRDFEDLSSIDTLGFRGEALCSISHVAHLTVASKAHVAKYHQSRMLSLDEVGVASLSLPGTRVIYEDLFFNQTIRRKSLVANDEYKRITQLIQRFALHFPNVAFTLKKSELTTNTDLLTPGQLNTQQVAELLFGLSPSDLLPLDCVHQDQQLQGVVARPTASSSAAAFFSLAINGRLVEAASVRKLVEELFDKEARSRCFAILNLRLNKTTVDVNVHPTKKDVLFQHKQQVFDFIKSAIRDLIRDASAVRLVSTASEAPAAAPATVRRLAAPSGAPTGPVPQSQKVRTDPTQATLVARPKNGTRMVWVGALDERLAAVQVGEDLLLVDVQAEAKLHPEIFPYQIYYLEEGLDFRSLIRRGLDDERVTDPSIFKSETEKSEIAGKISAKLRSHADLRVDETGELLQGFASFGDSEVSEALVERLPELLIRLALDDGSGEGGETFRWFVEASPMAALWETLMREEVELKQTAKVMASLSKLYREFERC